MFEIWEIGRSGCSSQPKCLKISDLELQGLESWTIGQPEHPHCPLPYVLDEEDRDIVSDDVPVALFSVKLDSESTNIADSIC